MKTSKRKRGGRILGEGKSARVIHPAIPCKDGRDMKKYTSRVLIKSRRTKPERDLISNNKILIQKLSKIDPSQRYFIYPEQCELGDMLEENITDGVTEDNKHYSEFMRTAGETWKSFYKHSKPSSKQKNHLKQAIELLHSNSIIHGDLTGNNIVIGSDGLPRLIDFGNSVYDAPEDFIDAEARVVLLVFPTFKRTSSQQRLVESLSEKKYELMREQQKMD
uniref:non-specific serine/threonine protein kinase n=1 Tax=viral metagenome TaxID=1070528 RepID=A0A6C0F238_9ZZZZ